jgi:hypothetical protein
MGRVRAKTGPNREVRLLNGCSELRAGGKYAHSAAAFPY